MDTAGDTHTYMACYGIGSVQVFRKTKRKYYKQALITRTKAEDKIFNRSIKWGAIIISGLLGWNIAGVLWLRLQMFLKATPFFESDPIFKMPLDFYMFQLPVYQQLLSIGIMFTFLLSAIILGYFFLMLAIRPPSEESVYSGISFDQKADLDVFTAMLRRDLLKPAVRKIAVLGMLIFIMIGVKYFLMTYELMYSAKGVAYGASYTDIHVTLLGYRMAGVVSFIAAFTFAYGLLNGNPKLVSFGPVLLIGVTFVFGIVGAVVQQLVVEPDEIGKESAYLIHNIQYTQKAFDLKDVMIQEFPVEQNIRGQTL